MGTPQSGGGPRARPIVWDILPTSIYDRNGTVVDARYAATRSYC